MTVRMLSLLFVFTCVSSSITVAAEPHFHSLFNGQNLDGWDGDPQFWRVEDGAIVGQTTAKKQPADNKNTFLIYRDGEFGDFELRFQFKVDGFNSGVQYRSVDTGSFHVTGLQADFEAQWHEDKETGKNFDRFSGMFFEEGGRMFMGQRGDAVVVRHNPDAAKKPLIQNIGSVGDSADLAKAIKHGRWNDYTVIAKGNTFVHIINGRVMSIGIDLDEPNFRQSGIIALQLHSGKPMRIEAKDIQIREI